MDFWKLFCLLNLTFSAKIFAYRGWPDLSSQIFYSSEKAGEKIIYACDQLLALSERSMIKLSAISFINHNDLLKYSQRSIKTIKLFYFVV